MPKRLGKAEGEGYVGQGVQRFEPGEGHGAAGSAEYGSAGDG